MAPPREPPRDHSQPLTELRYVVPREARGERLDRFLARHLTWRSRTGVQRLIEDRRVSLELNDAPAQVCTRPARRLQPPATVIIEIDQPVHPIGDPVDVPELEILYEDRWLLLIDKPAPLTVHPTGRHQQGTLIQLLHRRYRDPEDPARDIVPKLAHRLDRETSGLLLISKDDDVRHHLGIQFEKRSVEKHYLALVEGHPEREEGLIDLPLAPAEKSAIRIRMEARRDGRGLHSVTRYKVLERARDCSLVALRPLTGRQHQIRVHMAAIGHPVLGDKIYGPDENLFIKNIEQGLSPEEEALLRMPRHALHSWKLRFRHPKKGETMTVECALPEDFAVYLRENG